MKTEITLVHM